MNGTIYVKFNNTINTTIDLDYKLSYLVNATPNASSSVNLSNSGFLFSDVLPGSENYELKKKHGLTQWVKIDVAEGVNVNDELEKYSQQNNVIAVSCEREGVETSIIPDDPNFVKEWYLHNDGTLHGIPDADIDAPEAWDIETGNVIVAHFEDFRWYHSDLVDNVWQNIGDQVTTFGEDADHDGSTIVYNTTLGRYTIDWDDRNYQDDDQNGVVDDFIGNDYSDSSNLHGTRTAGVLMANTDNGIGISGVCWDCKMMSLSDIGTQSVYYAVNNGAKILSFSQIFAYDESYKDILGYAHDMGATIFIGAGNEGIDYPFSSCMDINSICVSESNTSDQILFASNYGYNLDVTAPGQNITTTNGNGDNSYISGVSGTSFATPIVAGVGALVLSKNPNLSPDEIISVIQSSTDPLVSSSPNKFTGNGRTNLKNALDLTLDSITYGSYPVAILDKTSIYESRDGYVVDILGRAYGDDFDKYSVRYGQGVYPNSWTYINQDNETPVEEGVLASFDMFNLDSGVYQVQLIVEDTNGQIAIDNMIISRPEISVHEGWPVNYAYDFPILEDIDNDGYLESISVTGSGLVYIFKEDGTVLNGWPYATGSTGALGSGVGDIDNDGDMEIVLTNATGGVWALNSDGSIYGVNWPVDLHSNINIIPVLSDLDNDGSMEIIVTSPGNKVYVLNNDGTNFGTNPYIFDGSSISGNIFNIPLVVDVDGDMNKDILFTIDDRYVYAIDKDGNNIDGLWPIDTLSSTGGHTSPMISADIDLDGENEIILFLSKKSKLYVFNQDGSTKFTPISVGTTASYNSYIHPIVADIAGDEKLEIIVPQALKSISGSQTRKIYAYDSSGQALPSPWPVQTEGYPTSVNHFVSTPLSIDLDGNGKDEILDYVISFLGPDVTRNTFVEGIFAWGGDGSEITENFPIFPLGDISVAGHLRGVSLADVDNDGKLNLEYSSKGKLYIRDLDVVDNFNQLTSKHRMDNQNTGVAKNYVNTTIKEVYSNSNNVLFKAKINNTEVDRTIHNVKWKINFGDGSIERSESMNDIEFGKQEFVYIYHEYASSGDYHVAFTWEGEESKGGDSLELAL